MSHDGPLRVLVVDDSLIYRKVVRDVLAEMPDVEVVGTANDGRQALRKIDQLAPDLVTLDLEMPELDGLGVLERLQARRSPIGALMLSAATLRGAATTSKALQLGAFDFVAKPDADSATSSLELLREALVPKVAAFASTRRPTSLERVSPGSPQVAPSRPSQGGGRIDVVAIGVSTGGPAALARILPGLPHDLAAPVLIVQHMPPMFTKTLADDLNQACALHVAEAVDGRRLTPGSVLIAPGGKQMKIMTVNQGRVVRITEDPPEQNCRPSVDYLFRSLAACTNLHVLAVILTGMGDDGTAGCRLLKQRAARLICQDQASCVVYGMPRQPIEEGLADWITPLDEIARQITLVAGRGASICG